jgi:squalene-associated FAD-dependent desaturase
MSRVLIIGGGFAGLSAGVALAEAGHQVELLERRAFLGGRAYSFLDQASGDVVDNGQHLLMGCYRETFKFLRKLGTVDRLRFQAQARVDFLDSQIGQATLLCPSLPAPLHLLAGLLRLRGLSLADKFGALRIGGALRAKNGAIQEKFGNLTVDEWLTSCGQSDVMKERFWHPFAIATLNEDTRVANAALLVRVLQEAFGGSKQDSTMVTAGVGLSELYTDQARAFIEARGGRVQLRAPVAGLLIENSRCNGARLVDGKIIKADHIISALPYFALKPLLPAEAFNKEPYFARWQTIGSSPIVSINLWFDRPITELGFAGLLGTKLQWMFNKDVIFARSPRDRQLLSFVISAAHKFSALSKERIIEMAIEDVNRLLPASAAAKVLRALVIKEQHATFSASVAAERMRPDAKTPVENFYLAGDWTNTGLPATIEGAVLSGHRCAELISKK